MDITGKNMENFNNLTPAEEERLVWLSKECGEVVQIIGKILRDGYESKHPDGELTNRELLEFKLSHILAAKRVMSVVNDDLDVKKIDMHMADKLRNVEKYMHHQNLK